MACDPTAQSQQTGDRMTARPAGGEFVSAGDARIFVQRLGPRDAPTVVFMHGTGSWSEAWRQSMVTAEKLGYQAVAIDLPPFGYSVPPASGDYSKPRQAARLLAALDSLGIRRAVFVAHSFGAAPVMEALIGQPQRASGLVLVDAALGLDSPQTDGTRQLPADDPAHQMAEPLDQRRLADQSRPHRVAVEEFYHRKGQGDPGMDSAVPATAFAQRLL